MEARYLSIPRVTKDNLEMLWTDKEHGCWYRNREKVEDDWNDWYKIPTRTYNVLRLALETKMVEE